MIERSPQPNVTARGKLFLFPLRFWLLVVLSGLAAGIGGGLLMRLLHAVQHWAYSYNQKTGDFISAVGRASGERRLLMLVAAGVIAGSVRGALRLAKGGHGGDLSESVWFHSGKLPLVRTLIRAVLSIVIVGLGVSLGREGALKQTGAAAASSLSDWFRLPAGQRRILVACAAGAGMAAAYNVPLGGALFALEVLLGNLTLPLLLPALATSFIATSVSWILLGDKTTYSTPAYTLHIPDIGWALLAGPIFGLLSFAWVRLIAWADLAKPSRWKTVVAPVIVFAALGAIAIVFPQVLGNGKGLVQRVFLNQLSLDLLLPLFLLKMIAAPGCLSSGAPGGLFTPTMTVGALLGGLLGHLWATVLPAPELGVFAILGSVAMLAAATQGPISSIVMVIELTRHVDALIVPMMMIVVTASMVSQRLEMSSVYSVRVREGMKAAEKPHLAGTSFDAWSTEAFTVSSSAARATTVLRRLLAGTEPMFVVDNEGRLMGSIDRERASMQHTDIPRQAMLAADLVVPTCALPVDTPRQEALRRMREQPSDAVPVIDPKSSKLVGAVAQRHTA